MKKPVALVLGLALFLAGCGHSSVVEKNNERFSNAVKSVTTEEVGLHDLADFEWDVMFTFAPYTPKESMEEIIGFQSDDIGETVNEGMTQLLFIKGEKVVCSIHGYSSNLGYGITFGTRYNDGHFLSVRHDESVLFSVDRSGGEISLLYEKADAMWDRRPMIMVDGKIYLDTGKQMPVEIAQSEILGSITSSVGRTEIPAENGESNFGGEGAQYAYWDNGLVVMLQNEWAFFEPEAE